MTIASEITRINNNIANAYTICNSKGATIPVAKNSANLADCIDSIQTGGASSKYGATLDSFVGDVDSKGVLQPTTAQTNLVFTGVKDLASNALRYSFARNMTIKSVSFPDLTSISTFAGLYNTFANCTNLTSADLSSLITVNGASGMGYTFSGTNLTSVDLSSLTTVMSTNSMNYTFYNCSNLANISFPNLEIIGTNSSVTGYGHFSNCFYNCTKLKTLTFPKLEKIYCNGGTTVTYGTFANNNKVEKMYFPKLDTITYGAGASTSDQAACKNVFYGCAALTELHFGAANQAAIEASPGYSTAWGRGAGNVTIYFDL